MFRLKIDIPLSEDEEEAIAKSKSFMEHFSRYLGSISGDFCFVPKHLQYLLANDEDRTIRNYLRKDANGKASTKKNILG